MVSTPKLSVVLAAVCVALATFQVTHADNITCYDCKDKNGKDCGGSDWKKKESKPKTTCTHHETKCVSVFNKDSKAVFRGCLDPTMDDLFQGRTCLEKTPDVLEVYAFVDGVFACACRNTPTILERHLCNIGFDSASGIEFKIGFLLGTPLILLVIQHFT